MCGGVAAGEGGTNSLSAGRLFAGEGDLEPVPLPPPPPPPPPPPAAVRSGCELEGGVKTPESGDARDDADVDDDAEEVVDNGAALTLVSSPFRLVEFLTSLTSDSTFPAEESIALEDADSSRAVAATAAATAAAAALSTFVNSVEFSRCCCRRDASFSSSTPSCCPCLSARIF